MDCNHTHTHASGADPMCVVPFVRLIRKYPALYDTSCDGYADRTYSELMWMEIARKVGDNVTNVKEKWRNIRSSYSRWLRSEVLYERGGKKKKPYYLAKHLEFLGPHHKNKQSLSVKTVKTEPSAASNDSFGTSEDLFGTSEDLFGTSEELFDSSDEGGKIDDSRELILEKHLSVDPSNDRPETSEHTYYQRLDSDKKDFCRKKQAKDDEHPTLLFFQSIMPDVKKLNDKQNLELKLMILEKLRQYDVENESKSSKSLNRSVK